VRVFLLAHRVRAPIVCLTLGQSHLFFFRRLPFWLGDPLLSLRSSCDPGGLPVYGPWLSLSNIFFLSFTLGFSIFPSFELL